MAGLLVQGEPRQVHGAAAHQRGPAPGAQCQWLVVMVMQPPDAVEDVAVREDPDVEVGGQDLVEARHLLIPEEGVRHPHLARVSQGQVADLV